MIYNFEYNWSRDVTGWPPTSIRFVGCGRSCMVLQVFEQYVGEPVTEMLCGFAQQKQKHTKKQAGREIRGNSEG